MQSYQDPTFGDRQKRMRAALPKNLLRLLMGGGAIFGVVAVLAFTGFFSSGQASYHIKYANVASSKYGSGWGMETFYVPAGRKVRITYEAKILKGEFHVWVRKSWAPITRKSDGRAKLRRSGSGQLIVPIKESGFYYISMGGMPNGIDRGYDIDYDVSWKVQ